MNVPLLIARRYLRPRRFSVISVIGLISVFGIVIGTAALVIVLSLFNGFRGIARDLMVGFGPHISLRASAQGGLQGGLHEGILEKLHAISPLAESKLVLQSAGRTGVVQAVGVRSDSDPILRGVRRSVFVGKLQVAPFDGLPVLTISTGVAESLKLFIGDTVSVMAPEQIERALTTLTMPASQKAIVGAVFQSNAARDIDQYRVYTSYDLVASLTGNNQPTSYAILLDDPREAPEVAERLKAELGTGVIVQTWEDLNRGLVDTMKLERLGSFIVLALIVLVASFNVLVSLTLGVVEKRRDIAVLQTIGLTPADIRTIYVVQGLVYGVVSVIIGLVIGLGICWGQQTFHWISFDMSQGFLVPALPMEIQAVDVLSVALVGMTLASVAAIYPARRAAGTVIADAIRVE
jgi:lipoprotein-releasing system permease protein